MNNANDATKSAGCCRICGQPGKVHLTDLREDQQTSHSYCVDHVPAHVRTKLPADFGTPAAEVAGLRRLLAVLDEQVQDATVRAETREELEKQIVQIEVGKGRLSDGTFRDDHTR